MVLMVLMVLVVLIVVMVFVVGARFFLTANNNDNATKGSGVLVPNYRKQ